MSATIDPELKRALTEIVDERIRELEVRRSDFIELKDIVVRLATAQERTDESIKGLTARMDQLTARMDQLTARMDQLAAAQTRTEEAVRGLATRMDELAAAQARTEKQLGRLGDNLGFGLEDIARVVVPGYLLRHHAIEMDEFERGYLSSNGQHFEVDLYAEGRRKGRKIIVLGEVKSRIHPREVKKFARVVEEVKPRLSSTIFSLMFAYWIHPTASLEAKKHDIELIASYQR